MAGSSVPPQTIWNKFGKPTKATKQKKLGKLLTMMKQELRTCRHCAEVWETNPGYYYPEILQRLTGLKHEAQSMPDAQSREEAAVLLLPLLDDTANRLKGLLEGRLPKSLLSENLELLEERYQRLFRSQLISVGSWTAPTTLPLEEIASKAQMQEYVEELIDMDALRYMNRSVHEALETLAASWGLYVPAYGLDNLRPEQHRYRPSIYLLFGFLQPNSVKEEQTILEAMDERGQRLIKRQYRALLAKYHPTDSSYGSQQVRAYWWQATQQAWNILEHRHARFGRSILVSEHAVELPRPIERLIQAPEPIRRGLLLGAPRQEGMR